MSFIGQNLGQYRIIESVGQGGMATVYKAYQPGLDRYVAVKILPAQHALTPGFRERFIREAQVVAKLNHPNILPIYDFGFEGDLSYFVMKLVPDRTLKSLMGRPVPLSQAGQLIDRVASALDHAHKQGVLHRDIKPSNILLDQSEEEDWVLLADFGLAKIVEGSQVITHSDAMMGTPAYMSPEQAYGYTLDQRTDIYSLGIVLYEMVTGRVPFEGDTPLGVIVKHISEPLPLPRSINPDLPERVEQVILKALAKEPSERYVWSGDMATALQEAIEQLPISTDTGSSGRPSIIAPAPESVSTMTEDIATERARTISDPGVSTSHNNVSSVAEVSRPNWLWFGGGILLLLFLCIIGGLIYFFTVLVSPSTESNIITQTTITQEVISFEQAAAIATLTPTATDDLVAVLPTSTPETPLANTITAPEIILTHTVAPEATQTFTPTSTSLPDTPTSTHTSTATPTAPPTPSSTPTATSKSTDFIDFNGYYYLQTMFLEAENKCLEGNRLATESTLSGAAFMDDCAGASGQLWKIVPAGNGYYYLQTMFLEAENKCLEGNRLATESTLDGAAFMDDCAGASGQLWKIVPAGNGYYYLQTMFLEAENKCLEGNRLATESTLGGAAFMDDCAGASGQLWNLIPGP